MKPEVMDLICRSREIFPPRLPQWQPSLWDYSPLVSLPMLDLVFNESAQIDCSTKLAFTTKGPNPNG